MVVDIKALKDVPPLTRPAVDAVKQWRYEPTMLNGEPVPAVISVTVSFMLAQHVFSFSALLASLKDEEEYIRAVAARTLGGVDMTKSRMSRAVEALEEVLEKDASPRVREAAARSLSQLDGRPLPPGMVKESQH